jgi:hypothetical protein
MKNLIDLLNVLSVEEPDLHGYSPKETLIASPKVIREDEEDQGGYQPNDGNRVTDDARYIIPEKGHQPKDDGGEYTPPRDKKDSK